MSCKAKLFTFLERVAFTKKQKYFVVVTCQTRQPSGLQQNQTNNVSTVRIWFHSWFGFDFKINK